MRNFVAILSLAVLSPALAELTTSSTLITNWGSLIFLIIGYSIPVLLLRDFAVRQNIGTTGMILWGAAYGIFNEGFLAKTFILRDNLPVRSYDTYGRFFGINFPWATSISIWHAFASVLFPILIVYYLNPQAKTVPWFNKKVSFVLLAILLLMGASNFLDTEGIPGTGLQLGILLGIFILLVALGSFLKARAQEESRTTLTPLFLGVSTIILFYLVAFIAGQKLNVALFFLLVILGLAFYRWLLRKNNWLGENALILFGVGFYIPIILQALFIRGFILHAGEIAALAAEIPIIIFLIWLTKRVRNSQIA